jgi:hypothetical protein
MGTDVLTMSRGERASTWWRRLAALVSVPVVGLLLTASLIDPTDRAERQLLPERSALQILLLGDSSAGRDSCRGRCTTYTEQLAETLRHKFEHPTELEDRSWRGNAWPPATVESVLAYVRTDSGLREVVRSADVLVLALTDRDGSQSSSRFAERLDTLLSEVSRIRNNRPILLGVVVASWPGESRTIERHVTEGGCQVTRFRDGACVNLTQLLHGDLLTTEDWKAIAGRPSLSQHGHDVVARVLIVEAMFRTARAPMRSGVS